MIGRITILACFFILFGFEQGSPAFYGNCLAPKHLDFGSLEQSDSRSLEQKLKDLTLDGILGFFEKKFSDFSQIEKQIIEKLIEEGRLDLDLFLQAIQMYGARIDISLIFDLELSLTEEECLMFGSDFNPQWLRNAVLRRKQERIVKSFDDNRPEEKARVFKQIADFIPAVTWVPLYKYFEEKNVSVRDAKAVIGRIMAEKRILEKTQGSEVVILMHPFALVSGYGVPGDMMDNHYYRDYVNHLKRLFNRRQKTTFVCFLYHNEPPLQRDIDFDGDHISTFFRFLKECGSSVNPLHHFLVVPTHVGWPHPYVFGYGSDVRAGDDANWQVTALLLRELLRSQTHILVGGERSRGTIFHPGCLDFACSKLSRVLPERYLIVDGAHSVSDECLFPDPSSVSTGNRQELVSARSS
ncbi:MAG: hypothetical protein JW774_02945 [Candidatus Aureabacteria bacterium]|nr:hypothetical protein [Candidatus Auribacterota bacterium]